jgi:hypothetical protein
MSAILILSGQLLGAAFACGLNLYLTIAVLGISARLDLLTRPATGSGRVGERHRHRRGCCPVYRRVHRRPDPGRRSHLGSRPHPDPSAAAGLLVALALTGAANPGAGRRSRRRSGLLAAHGTKAGVRMILTPRWIDEQGRIRPRRTLARTAASLLEDVAAAAIAIAALVFPGVAVFIVGGALLLLLVAGPRLWRAAMLGLRAVSARARGFFGRPGWRCRSELPRSIRRVIPQEPMGTRPARAISATVNGLARAGAYRHGWLVFTCEGPRFVYSSGFRAHCTTIPTAERVEVRRGLLADTLEVQTPQQQAVTFFLLKDGPPPDVTAAELSGTTT